jgi:hypothetical protein
VDLLARYLERLAGGNRKPAKRTKKTKARKK